MLARREPRQNCNQTCYGFVRMRTACILYTWIDTTLVRMAACSLLRTAARLFCALLDWCASRLSISSSKNGLKMLLPHHLRSVLPFLGAAFACTHPGADARVYGGDCRARGYESIGCDQARTFMWTDVAYDGKGYCGSEFTAAGDASWQSMSTCTAAKNAGDKPGVDYILLQPGCSVEVATGEEGKGDTYVYHDSIFLGVQNGVNCMRLAVPGFDAVWSYRLFNTPGNPVPSATDAPSTTSTTTTTTTTPCRAYAYQTLDCNSARKRTGITWSDTPRKDGEYAGFCAEYTEPAVNGQALGYKDYAKGWQAVGAGCKNIDWFSVQPGCSIQLSDSDDVTDADASHPSPYQGGSVFTWGPDCMNDGNNRPPGKGNVRSLNIFRTGAAPPTGPTTTTPVADFKLALQPRPAPSNKYFFTDVTYVVPVRRIDHQNTVVASACY